MKKLIALLLICTLCLCFAACDKNEAEPTTEPATEPTTENTEPFDWDSNNSLSTGMGCGGQDTTVDE